MFDAVYIDSLQIHSIPVDPNYAVSKLTGVAGSPQGRDDRPDNVREHGLIELTTFYGGRPIELKGMVKASSLAAFWPLWDNLKKQFALNGLVHTLKWERQGLGYLEKCDVSVAGQFEEDFPVQNQPFARYTVDLIAADPRIYTAASTTASIGGSGTVTTLGTFPTKPIITVTGASGTLTVTNTSLSTENTIVINGVTGTVVIDTSNKTVTVGGVLRPDLVNAASTFWFALKAGANVLTASSGSISVTWFDARI